MNVVIGKPLVQTELLYGEETIDLITEERFLPRILKELGVFKSTSEVRRNRPDLWIELTDVDFKHIKIGRKHLWITIGE